MSPNYLGVIRATLRPNLAIASLATARSRAAANSMSSSAGIPQRAPRHESTVSCEPRSTISGENSCPMPCRTANRRLAAMRTTGQTWDSFPTRARLHTVRELAKSGGLGGGVSAKPLARPRPALRYGSHLFFLQYRLDLRTGQHGVCLAIGRGARTPVPGSNLSDYATTRCVIEPAMQLDGVAGKKSFAADRFGV